LNSIPLTDIMANASGSASQYHAKSPLSASSSMYSTDLSDNITPVRSPLGQYTYSAEDLASESMFPTALPRHPGSLLSPFRTQLAVPTNIFVLKPKVVAPTSVPDPMTNTTQQGFRQATNSACGPHSLDVQYQPAAHPVTVPKATWSGPSTNAAASRSVTTQQHTHARQQSIELEILPAPRVLADHVTVRLPGSTTGETGEETNKAVKVETKKKRRESI
jgi:hypothetical protein